MGKYIIELERGETAYKTVDLNGTPLIQLLDPLPYTESDTEQVMEDAFKNGYDTACKDIDVKSKTNAAYRKGLEDAWDAARKIVLSREDGGLFGYEERKAVFGCGNYMALKTFLAPEAIKKIRQYEQEQKDFKVGDEVISDEDIKGVTVDMDDYLLHVLDENGVIQAWPIEDAVKTGRYFPEIAEVLRKMQEEKE